MAGSLQMAAQLRAARVFGAEQAQARRAGHAIHPQALRRLYGTQAALLLGVKNLRSRRQDLAGLDRQSSGQPVHRRPALAGSRQGADESRTAR